MFDVMVRSKTRLIYALKHFSSSILANTGDSRLTGTNKRRNYMEVAKTSDFWQKPGPELLKLSKSLEHCQNMYSSGQRCIEFTEEFGM